VALVVSAACDPDFDALYAQRGTGGGGSAGANDGGNSGRGGGGGISGGGGLSGEEAGAGALGGTEAESGSSSGGSDGGSGAGSKGGPGGSSGEGGASNGGKGGSEPCEPDVVVAGDPPILHYEFEEGTGTVLADSSASAKAAELEGGSWNVVGKSGAAVSFEAEGQRVTLPNDVIGALDSMTVMVWANLDAAPVGSTLFDFGLDATNHLQLQVTDGMTMRLVAKTTTLDETLLATMALPAGGWRHVAVSIGGGEAIIHVDGRPLARGAMTFKPSDLGSAALGWLGQPFAGPAVNLYASVDDFRLYDRVVSAKEISALVMADADYIYFPFDETCGNTVVDISPLGLEGTLPAGGTFVEGRLNGALKLDGINDFVDLPDGIVTSCMDFTFASWVYLDANPFWTRIMDFGLDAGTFVFITTNSQSGGTNVRFALKLFKPIFDPEEMVNRPGALPVGSWQHVAGVMTEGMGYVYVNGEQAGNAPIAGKVSDMGSTRNNWLGRSQYALDPYLNGRLDEIVISCRAFSLEEIQLLSRLAP